MTDAKRREAEDLCLALADECGADAFARARERRPDLRDYIDAVESEWVSDTEGLLQSRTETAPPVPPLPASIGGFEVREVLGHGGMGWVYRAYEASLGREVAIKVLAPRVALRGDAKARFLAEAKLIGRLRHPAIVTVHGARTTDDGEPYLVMDVIEGRSLAKVLESVLPSPTAPLSPRAFATDPGPPGHSDPAGYFRCVARIVAAVADATDHAHGRGVIHCDIKPGNILVDDSGAPHLLDFGLARALGGDVDDGGFGAGSPLYMAPEQIDGAVGAVGAATDSYGLGVTLYQALVRRVPFRASSSRALRQAVLSSDAPPARSRDPRVPAALDGLCRAALRKNPKARPRVAEIAEELRAFLAGRPSILTPPPAPVRAAMFVARHRQASALAALGLILLTGGPTAIAIVERSARERLAEEQQQTLAARAQATFLTARLFAQRGRWEEAIGSYEGASESGYDPIACRLARVEALDGALRGSEAIAELRQLRAEGVPPEHRAKLLLLDADLDVNRLVDPDTKLAQVREAIELGLTPADEAYAEAMLAEHLDELVDHLERARRHEPTHRRANGAFAIALIGQGRLAEAADFSVTLRALYPEDPTAMGYAGFVSCLRGDEARVRILIEQARAADEERAVDLLSAVAGLGELISVFHGPWAVERESGVGSLVRRTLRIAGPLVAMLNQRKTANRTDGAGATTAFPLPPVIARHYVPLIRAVPMAILSARGREKLRQVCSEALEHLTDPLLLVLRGALAAGLGDERAGIEDLEAALERPSVFSQRWVLGLLLTIRGRQFDEDADGEGVRDGYRSTVERLLAWSTTGYEHEILLQAAQHLESPELARQVAAHWRAACPEDPRADAALSARGR